MGLFSENKFKAKDIKKIGSTTEDYVYIIIHKKTERFYIGSRSDGVVKPSPDIVTGLYNTSSTDLNFKNEFENHKDRFEISIYYCSSRKEAYRKEHNLLRQVEGYSLAINRRFFVDEQYLEDFTSSENTKEKVNYSDSSVSPKNRQSLIKRLIKFKDIHLLIVIFKFFLFFVLPITLYLSYLFLFITFFSTIFMFFWVFISLCLATILLIRILVVSLVFLGVNLFLLIKSFIKKTKFILFNKLTFVKSDSVIFSIFKKQNYYSVKIYFALRSPLIVLWNFGKKFAYNKVSEMVE